YEPVSPAVVRSTEHTVGPWKPTDQHAGPPAALLVRELEAAVPAGGWLTRVTVDLPDAVPVAELAMRSRVLRAGRSVQLTEAELLAGDRVVARATGWWHRIGDTAAAATPAVPPPPMPEPAADRDPRDRWPSGYLHSMEWRWVTGHFSERGPATVWSRMRLPLVAGEDPTPTQRVFATADSASGAGSTLPWSDWLFVNTELTVHLLRPPLGEWVCLDATTTIGSTGGGLASSRLSDMDGEVGRGAQALVVRPR
ncbi:MAG TPA: thioesterase family protein, partial [Mycobacteriales bacterium]|nr:thioesterase family protein [Mycobacteriales bacterium]